MVAEAETSAARRRQTHDPVRRRDPPLQPGPAGRLPAPRREGHHRADRRHHREPVVRGELGALLSRCRVYVLRGARRGRPGHAHAPRAGRPRARPGPAPAPRSSDDALRARSRGSGQRRRAHGAQRPGAGRAAGADAGGRRASPRRRIREAAQKRTLLYDKSGEEHYNLISALHKSLRDSDPDAALYWLARMLEAGEDPLYVARRLVRFASEDVGNADPRALTLALAAKDAYHFLGTPEGELALAQATLLPRAGAEVQRRVRRVQRGDGRRAGTAGRAGAAAHPQRAHRAHEATSATAAATSTPTTRPTRWSPGAPAGVAARPAVLPAHRPRSRGRAGAPSGRLEALAGGAQTTPLTLALIGITLATFPLGGGP